MDRPELDRFIALEKERNSLRADVERLLGLLAKSCSEERNLAVTENLMTHACDAANEMQAEIEKLKAQIQRERKFQMRFHCNDCEKNYCHAELTEKHSSEGYEYYVCPNCDSENVDLAEEEI